jgi:CubicO group peptidase (beta-lactamase class C family)
MLQSLRARVRVAGVLVLCLAAGRVAGAQARTSAPPLTAQDLETFLDGMVPLQLRQNDIAGTVVTVVKDGKVIFSKGYGYSDVKLRTPVTADATLFRVGSISKTFTWTAVMQLVEQGKIDLDRDVSTYVDFKIPSPFGKPVTMRNLLTHTPGFEQPVKDMMARDAVSLAPLGTYVKTHLPLEIYPPGTTPSYSNYGATLAGYIVERVSGVPFDEYISKNILQPLGMTRATFDQPLPNGLKSLMSEGYAQASQPAKPFETVQPWPAGSLSATAEAMSHFMIAHLQDGEYNGARILKPETARLMHSRLFGVSPALNAMAYGFYEESRNGHRIIGHGGDTQWFHSDMHLMLDDHLGFFISSNSAGKAADLRSVVWSGFLDRYYPYSPADAPTLPTALSDARSVAGTYMSSRRSETGITAVFNLIQEDVRVNADSTISGGERDAAGNPKHFREIAPLVFRELNGQSRLAFTKDQNGILVMSNDEPFVVAQRVDLLKNGHVNIDMLVCALSAFLLMLLSWPVAVLLQKHYGTAPELPAGYRKLRWLVRAASLASVLFVVLFALKFTIALQSDLAALSSSADTYFHVLQALGFLGVLGLPVAAVYCVSSWRARPLWVWTKVWNTLMVLAFAAYTAFVLNWHLLNVTLQY